MILPKELALSAITTRGLYLDKKSEDKDNPGRPIKAKYKLGANSFPELEVFTFIVSTSKIESCKRSLTLSTKASDWTERDNRYSGISHFDIRRVDAISPDELYSKICDGENCFNRVGLLKSKSFKKLKFLKHRANTEYAQELERSKRNDIFLALGSKKAIDSIPDTILQKLGL